MIIRTLPAISIIAATADDNNNIDAVLDSKVNAAMTVNYVPVSDQDR